ncbi:hypothetical protein DVR12_17695 [Chitinophaga silvatica]|uniref:Uncharacterized protein n=1 Tax=Chitinophaga silvatica TaxID=2282649 RepID=A0A3E1Y7W0_9BACT|nr:hypothetical protein [Chitinophaga silvatica]RFS21167.1 hypothetical protein DVR12_17695 [Chitinophaga silvatica]
MDRNISKYLNQFESESKKYEFLMRKVQMGAVTYDDLRREIDLREIEKLRTLCIDEYANILKKESDLESVFYEWIKTATDNDDFYLLEVLLLVETRVTNVDFTRVDLHLLNYFVEYFGKSVDLENMNHAKYLFEWVPDVLDNDTEECSEILERIFLLGKPSEWYEGFYDQIMKLTLRAPVNEKTFSAVKKGLSVETTPEIRTFLEEYLEVRMS